MPGWPYWSVCGDRSDNLGEDDRNVNIDDVNSAQVQPTADSNVTLTLRNVDTDLPNPLVEFCQDHPATTSRNSTTSVRDRENVPQYAEHFSDQHTREPAQVKKRKCRKKKSPNPRKDETIRAKIVSLPVCQDCFIARVVCELILSKCSEDIAATSILALTKLFYGLGSRQSLEVALVEDYHDVTWLVE